MSEPTFVGVYLRSFTATLAFQGTMRSFIPANQSISRLPRLPDNTLVAVRLFFGSDVCHSYLRQMRQEIEIMRHLYHRNVVILFEVLEENAYAAINDPDDEGRVCMVQENMEGGATMTCDDETGLFTRTRWRVGGAAGAGETTYSETEAKQLFRDLAEGLLYLHSRGIIHRDIKVRLRHRI